MMPALLQETPYARGFNSVTVIYFITMCFVFERLLLHSFDEELSETVDSEICVEMDGSMTLALEF